MINTPGIGASLIKADFQTTHDISSKLLGVLADSKVSVGYGMLGCALTLGRLARLEDQMKQEEEIQFIQDLTQFIGAYWGDGNDTLN